MSEDDPRPIPPERPQDDMCCGRGCTPCIFDYYETAVARYEEALEQWLARHPEAAASGGPPGSG